MSNPTPGPWKALEYTSEDTSKYEKDIVIYGPGGSLLAIVHVARWGRQQAVANARSMAASREMLDALEGVQGLLEMYLEWDHPTWVGIRAAIAKARGPEADSG